MTKISMMTNIELYNEYVIVTNKIKDMYIISQSNPAQVLELRYYTKKQNNIYQELQKRNDNANKIISI
jgi:hypothetical protein